MLPVEKRFMIKELYRRGTRSAKSPVSLDTTARLWVRTPAPMSWGVIASRAPWPCRATKRRSEPWPRSVGGYHTLSATSFSMQSRQV